MSGVSAAFTGKEIIFVLTRLRKRKNLLRLDVEIVLLLADGEPCFKLWLIALHTPVPLVKHREDVGRNLRKISSGDVGSALEPHPPEHLILDGLQVPIFDFLAYSTGPTARGLRAVAVPFGAATGIAVASLVDRIRAVWGALVVLVGGGERYQEENGEEEDSARFDDFC